MDQLLRDKETLIQYWRKVFKAATDLDAWGQPVEAIVEYAKLVRALNKALVTDAACDGQQLFSEDEKRIMNKVVTCIELRRRGLDRPGIVHAISLIDLKHIQNDLSTLMKSRPSQFPIDVTAAQAYVYSQSNQHLLAPNPPDVFDEDEDPAKRKARGNLLPGPVPIDGRTVVTVRVERIGIKHSDQYIEPFINVYVKDRLGADLAPMQTTPLAAQKLENYVIFNTDVHIPRHLEALPEGFAILFEFCHYKPRKKQESCRCWAFVERDEIKEGPCCVEIYKKPMDPKRKRLRLFSSSALYLHLRILLN